MHVNTSLSAGYGQAIAAFAYSAFSAHLIRAGWNSHRGSSLQAEDSGRHHAPGVFLAAVVASAAWGWLGAAAQFVDSERLRVWQTGADLLRYGCWFLFLLTVLRPVRQGRPTQMSGLLTSAAAMLLLISTISAGALEYLPHAQRLYGRYALYIALTMPVFGLVLVEQLFRNVSVDARWNAKPLCLGLGCIFGFDLYLQSDAVLFGEFDDGALSIRGAIHALAVPLFLIASRRRLDWAAGLEVSRTAAFHTATLLLAGVYLIFISAIGYYVRYFGGEWGRALQLALLFLALVLLSGVVLSGAMRAKLRVSLGKHFFRYRYDYRQEWLRFTATLSAHDSPQDVGERVIRGLSDLLESPAGSLWSKAPGRSDLTQAAAWNMPRSSEGEPLESVFCRFLSRTGWIVSIDEYRDRPERYGDLQVPPWLLATPRAWLVIPLLVTDELIGFVVLARPRTTVEVDWEVTDLLKTASRQAASFLAQMRATEALLEVRKFDAFNRMSAFVVHDLKNIITQLTLMMKNAKRLHDNPEFQQDMLMTVENSLEKMRQLMLQLREGEAPPGGVSGVDLAPIVQHIESLASARGRSVELELIDRVVTRGHEQRIERVLGHLVHNALDATTSSDRVWITVKRSSGHACVEVRDTGRGMSSQFIRDRLFKPFQTTKEAGMGIGAYESYQYVRELGGTISVESEVQRGTTVTVLLPLFDSRQDAGVVHSRSH